jgi:pimeloyl-ACP methyl ester carboxylesterase
MRRHVVIVPGYYGSNLRDRISNILFWLSQFSVQKPEHTLKGIALPASDRRVFVDGIVDDVAILKVFKIPIYHTLIRFLVHGMGYDPTEVHTMGIDWRRPIKDSIDIVRAAISNAFQTSGQPVDLIAHSHGGLVARAYLATDGPSQVNKLLTFGTPHIGMLETFEAMIQGITLLRFDRNQLMLTARAFPSAYELLPVTTDFFKWNQNATSPLSVDAWCPAPEMKPMVADAAAAMQALPSNVPVPLFAIHGTRTDTTTHADGDDSSGAPRVSFATTDDGDGTVPLTSGAAVGITAVGDVQRFAVPFGGHAFMFDDRNTQEVIRHILREDPAPPAYFVAAWRATMFLPHETNRVVVNLDDLSGLPIPNATVTLTLPTQGITKQPIPHQTNGDYVLDVQMPGAGTMAPYIIEASAPSLPKSFRASGQLVAAAN